MFKICCVFGTRPEIIKMAPVIIKLRQIKNIRLHIACSGQHRELLTPIIEWFDLKIDINFDLMQENQDINELSSRLLGHFGKLFKKEQYDCVLAQGDTTTVLMAAISAFYAKIPFAHIEAGLRTYNRTEPFPEEMNRVLIGKLASLHFAPTQTTANNLTQEGVPLNTINITGNTVIDALYYTIKKLDLKNCQPTEQKIILVTTHRRENFGEPLKIICNSLLKIAKNHPTVSIVFPVHPNPMVRNIVHNLLTNITNITLLEPLSYNQLILLMNNSYLILTDSGGLQEEASALNKPVLVMRNTTDRPESVALGAARLVGANEKLIVDTTELLLTNVDEYKKMIPASSPYGDGNAANIITNKLIEYLAICDSRRMLTLCNNT